MAELIAAIAAYQEQQDMTDQQVAAELDCPRSTWTATRLGLITPSLRFARKIVDVPRFKDLATKVLLG